MLTSSRPDTRLLDRGEAERFLTALDPTAEKWTFQSFDDNQDRKDKSLARVLHGTLARNWSALVELNERGAGVFVTINKTDFAGRKKANIKSVRALFSDLDGAPLDPVLAEGEPKPHILTETSPGKYHTYWRAADVPLEEFTPTQKVIAKRYGSDPQVNDLPRVMRLPGFIHRKGEPFVSRLVQANDFDPYTWAELSKIFRDRWKGVPKRRSRLAAHPAGAISTPLPAPVVATGSQRCFVAHTRAATHGAPRRKRLVAICKKISDCIRSMASAISARKNPTRRSI
jgi:hypothetical protein